MGSNDSGDREFLWRSTGEESGGEERTGGAATATDQPPSAVERAKELAQWWWGWWLSRHGYSGIVLPAGLAVLYWLLLGWPASFLGAGLGIFARLLWARGTGLAKTGGAVTAALPLVVVLLPVAAFVVIQILWLVPIILVAYLGRKWLDKRRRPEPTGHYYSRWSDNADTEDMRMSGGGPAPAPASSEPQPNGDRSNASRANAGAAESGIMLAHHDGQPIGVYPGYDGKREMGHILVTGPNRCGKGLHLMANLFGWRGPVIVNDIKGELYATTARYRKERLGSEVLVLDPSGVGSRYDPFAELSYSQEALRTAAKLVMKPEQEDRRVFADRAVDAVYAAALAARIEGRATLPYIFEATEYGPKRFVERLWRVGDREVRRAVIRFLGQNPDEVSDEFYERNDFFNSCWSAMTTKLQPLFTEGILRMCSGSDFEAADLVRGTNKTLYLRFAESELDYTEDIYQVVLMALIKGLINYRDKNPARADESPLLWALDEAGRTPIPELDKMVSTISGRGMAALIYIQDLKQFDAAYDDKRANVILAGCHTKVFYRPVEPDTAKYISRMSGQTSVEDTSVSRSEKPHNPVAVIPSPVNVSNSMRERELITEDEAMQISPEDVFVFVSGRKILARRLRWFEMMPEAAEFAEDHPPDEPEEIPLPESLADMYGHGCPDPQAKPEDGVTTNDTGEESTNGGKRRKRGSGGGRGGGYIEPDV